MIDCVEFQTRYTGMKYVNFFVWVLVLLLSSCNNKSERNESTSDSSGREKNSDEVPTEVALEQGQARVRFVYTPPGNDNESVELTLISNEPRIFYDDGANMCPPGWGLMVPIESDELAEEGAIFLWFNDTDTSKLEMVAGESDVSIMSVDLPPIENGGKAREPEGTVTITETTGKSTSGWWRGNEEISIAFYAPDASPSGEIFQVKEVAFNGVETQIPKKEAPCDASEPGQDTSDGDSAIGGEPCDQGWSRSETSSESTRECNAIYNDLCFESNSFACACAGCDVESCSIVETYPTQVMCE